MKRFWAVIWCCVVSTQVQALMCDLRHFRAPCELTFHQHATPSASSLVRCGNVYGYVRPADYDTLVHYQRVNIQMSLDINDERELGHCIPIERFRPTYF